MRLKTKLIIILILVVAILATSVWFFGFYRTDVTASVFAYWADRFAEAGRYERALSFYQIAGKLTPGNERVPIVLAQTYAGCGNYTKAEYTLVNAITEHPEQTELYIALCRIYIEQDKLLDAEQMLERISNESVKQTIDALRPTAPTLSPESGYYDKYITVTAASDTGKIYLTATTDFPSLAKDEYVGGVQIEGGETNVVAISVSQNGLVSTATYAGYTVGNVVEPVTLDDPAIDDAVRELLGKQKTDRLMTNELWEIEELTIPEGAKSLGDLVKFTGLKSLTVHASAGLNLSVLQNLTALQTLDVSKSTLSTAVLNIIGALPDLTSLNISSCAVENIDMLAGLTDLTYLNLANNTVSDITALSNMTELQELHLTNNPIRTVSYLNNCLKLEKLYVESCQLSKLTSIAGNEVITELFASENKLTDISVLKDCKSLQILDVSGNEIEDISVLPELPALTTFKGDHNKLTAIPTFNAKTSELVNINVSYNEITDLKGLAGLQHLNYVRADYNKITDVSVLGGCYTLIQIDVWNNPIKTDNIQGMQDSGIIINYNPDYKPS